MSLKAQVYAHYGSVCRGCGTTDSQSLTIDHVHNDGHWERRKERRKYSAPMIYRFIVEEGFPDRYQVLCRNCNWKKHANGGVLPERKEA
jgi:hypothetical protein